MNTNNEIDKILSDLKKGEGSKRQRTSLYLSGDLYKEFRLVCGEIPPSKVIEKLMRAVIEQEQRPA
jgi:hypothetical protein